MVTRAAPAAEITAAGTAPGAVGGANAPAPFALAACWTGDREALRALFEAHKDRVYSLALAFFHGDAATAEDVAQEVFVKMATRLGEFRGEAALATYLYRLTANACVDEQRRRKRLVPLAGEKEDHDDLAAPAPEGLAERHEMARAVQAAIADLPPDLRVAVLLRYFDDLSYDEMAHALGCAPGTVASRLHRGLKRLGRTLAAWRHDADK